MQSTLPPPGSEKSDPRSGLYRSLSLAVDAMRRQIIDLLKQHGFSEPQYEVLEILRASSEALACGEIGARMLTRDPDVTRLLNRLEERGFVERTRAATDRRVVSARLTPSGLAALVSLEQPLAELRERQLRAFGENEADTLLLQLTRIRG